MNTGIVNVCGPREALIFRRLVREHHLPVRGRGKPLELVHVPKGRLVALRIESTPKLPHDMLVRCEMPPDVYMEWEEPSWFNLRALSWPHGHNVPGIEFRTVRSMEDGDDETLIKYTISIDVAVIVEVRR